jgi:hypothetical protein
VLNSVGLTIRVQSLTMPVDTWLTGGLGRWAKRARWAGDQSPVPVQPSLTRLSPAIGDGPKLRPALVVTDWPLVALLFAASDLRGWRSHGGVIG